MLLDTLKCTGQLYPFLLQHRVIQHKMSIVLQLKNPSLLPPLHCKLHEGSHFPGLLITMVLEHSKYSLRWTGENIKEGRWKSLTSRSYPKAEASYFTRTPIMLGWFHWHKPPWVGFCNILYCKVTLPNTPIILLLESLSYTKPEFCYRNRLHNGSQPVVCPLVVLCSTH